MHGTRYMYMYATSPHGIFLWGSMCFLPRLFLQTTAHAASSQGGGPTIMTFSRLTPLAWNGTNTGMLENTVVPLLKDTLWTEDTPLERTLILGSKYYESMYSGPCDLTPLYLTIPCILRPDISDTTCIFSV